MASTTSRQAFSGGDDLLLLARVERAAPWRLRSGVMEVWQQTAQALNADPACSLAGLSAASTRARFFRLVAQRRERQDKMLRRSASDEAQFQAKIAILDRLIARMDADNEETSLHRLLSEVDDDAPTVGVALQMPLLQPSALNPVPNAIGQLSAASHALPGSRERAKPTTSAFQSATAGQTSSESLETATSFPTRPRLTGIQQRPSVQRPMQEIATHPSPMPCSAIIPADSPDSSISQAPKPNAAGPLSKKRAREEPDESLPLPQSFQGSLERVVDRALVLMQRKFELDRECAEADRILRREEMRARTEDMRLMRAQTDRLIMAVLDLAKSK